EHAARRVHADHGHPGGGCRNGDAAGADAELHDRAAGCDRLLHVEGDVLDHPAAPRVVEPRDRVVGAAGYGFLVTHTNSRLSSSNGRRSNQPYRASTSSPATSTSPSHSDRATHQSDIGPRGSRPGCPMYAVTSIRLSDGTYSVNDQMPSPCEDACPCASAARNGSNTNAFQANRPPGRRAAATRSNTRRRSRQVGRWRSERHP